MENWEEAICCVSNVMEELPSPPYDVYDTDDDDDLSVTMTLSTSVDSSEMASRHSNEDDAERPPVQLDNLSPPSTLTWQRVGTIGSDPGLFHNGSYADGGTRSWNHHSLAFATQLVDPEHVFDLTDSGNDEDDQPQAKRPRES